MIHGEYNTALRCNGCGCDYPWEGLANTDATAADSIRAHAARHGWLTDVTPTEILDYCPECVRKRERTQERGAAKGAEPMRKCDSCGAMNNANEPACWRCRSYFGADWQTYPTLAATATLEIIHEPAPSRAVGVTRGTCETVVWRGVPAPFDDVVRAMALHASDLEPREHSSSLTQAKVLDEMRNPTPSPATGVTKGIYDRLSTCACSLCRRDGAGGNER